MELILTRLAVIVIGDDGHGKTALITAISRLAKRERAERYPAYDGAYSSPQCYGPDVDDIRYAEYATDQRTIEFVDYPSFGDYHQQLASGAIQPDGVVVVVSALVGCSRRTEDALNLAGEAGVKEAVVWVSHCDLCDDPTLLELLDAEARKMLIQSGFSADTPMIHGAAVEELRNNSEATSKLRELLSALDRIGGRAK